MEARTSASSLSISFIESVACLYKCGASPLTLLCMRSEHLESCRLDAVEACQSQGSANAFQQLTFGELRMLWCRLDGIRYVLHMAQEMVYRHFLSRSRGAAGRRARALHVDI